MKTSLWINKVPLLKLVYPSIIRWAQEYDYNIPSISTLAAYTVKFLDCESYESTYRGEKIQALGTCYSTETKIKVAGKRAKLDIISTLIHEFAHAVQHFNYGKEWCLLYSTEADVAAHGKNKYEDEARALQTDLRRWMMRDSILRTDIFAFEFELQLISKPKPAPEPAPKKEYKARYYYPLYRRSEAWYKSYTKDWWNY
jgi:hypothetical protein